LITTILLVVLGQTVEVLDSRITVTAIPVIVFKREKEIEDSGNIFGYEGDFDGLMTRILVVVLE
jgi:tetrahydromethanopterin S-methyltransferase subunit C